MQIYHFKLLLCCSFLVACSSADTTFPREEIITQELMPLQGITYPIRIEVKHPFLILQNLKMTDSLFHIYNLTNYELKNTFGTIGQGPGEFTGLLELLHTQLSDIFISNISTNMVYMFGVDEEGQPIPKGAKQANYSGYSIVNAAFINDSLYVLNDQIAPDLNLLSLHDELPRKTRQYRSYNITDDMEDPDMGYVYANESRVVLCYGYKKQVDFMDIDLNLIKRVNFKYQHPALIKSENQDDVKLSYVTGYLGKHYFYVLFLGVSWKEHRDMSGRGTFLEVFDLDGNPVAGYQLEGIGPVNFAVDEETFTLYGAGEDGQPEDYLLVYKLKGLFF